MGFLFVAGLTLIGRACIEKAKQADQIKRGLAAIAPNAKIAPITTIIASRIAKQNATRAMAKYIHHVQMVLGNTTAGKISFTLFIRHVMSHARQNNQKVANLCVSSATCPVNLSQLYVGAINKFDPNTDVLARVSLQAEMLSSQISAKEKRQILLSVLYPIEHSKGGRSISVKNGKTFLSPLTQYEVLTLAQYEKLELQPEQFFNTVLTVAKNSHDPVGRSFLVHTLNKAYPQYKSEILSQEKKLGMTLAAR